MNDLEQNRFDAFVREHLGDDTARLLLSRGRWPDVDVALAADTIEGMRRMRHKVPEWDVPGLVYPDRLCTEQASSSATARFKASLIRGMGAARVADLTGGLGVDSWAFSDVAEKVFYNEMNVVLRDAVEHNFGVLGVRNVLFHSVELLFHGVKDLLGDFAPDVIFLDPARRGEGGRKVFLIEDCRPDVVTLLPELLEVSPRVVVKLSPMADISMVVSRLDGVRDVYAVASGGECKELLVLIERGFAGVVKLHAVELGEKPEILSFGMEEKGEVVRADGVEEGMLLFEPGKALMKTGAFGVICSRFGLGKIGIHTHLYVAPGSFGANHGMMLDMGKWFRVVEVLKSGKEAMRKIRERWPRAEVTARNVPMTSDQLRAKLKVASGGDVHVFCCRADYAGGGSDVIFIVAEPLR
ncbi:MAG: hypothetical protein IK143_03525 [Bacteroidales bacterium]|nr:hypothetical protein [Bacteroidales bacterium]